MFKGFKNVFVYRENEGLVKSDIVIEDGKFAGFETTEQLPTLPEELIVVPGFIDKHVHGAAGQDSMYPTQEALEIISAALAEEGVTAFLATTMTQTEEQITAAVRNIGEYIKRGRKEGAEVLGIHMEGPFVSKKYKGAQPEHAIVPCDVEMFQRLEAASGGNIRCVSLAPEENGMPLVKYLVSRGIMASIGHCDATFAEAQAAFAAGADSATHAYNAMRGLHHREAGTLGAAFLNNHVYCELIADLIHVSGPAIEVLFKVKGPGKVCAITDGMEAKHLPDGKYSLGGQDVYVKDGAARLKDGTLAGSILWLNEGLRNIQKVTGLTFLQVVDLATINPAKNLGIAHKKGSIKFGKDADLTVIDKDFNVYLTVRGGNIVYQNKKLAL